MSTFKAYITGFVLSIVLTVAAYIPVWQHVSSGHLRYAHSNLIAFVLGIAVLQLLVQLILFLHLGREKKSRWNISVFVTTVSLILIVVVGSIWIMNHLNNNMSPQQINDYLNRGDAF